MESSRWSPSTNLKRNLSRIEELSKSTSPPIGRRRILPLSGHCETEVRSPAISPDARLQYEASLERIPPQTYILPSTPFGVAEEEEEEAAAMSRVHAATTAYEPVTPDDDPFNTQIRQPQGTNSCQARYPVIF